MRSPFKPKLFCFQHLEGWRKVLGVLAIVMTLLIVLNPEFLALGIIGDAAFFDVLVLAISLQLQVYVVRVVHFIRALVVGRLRRLYTPSIGGYYLYAVSSLAIASVISAI